MTSSLRIKTKKNNLFNLISKFLEGKIITKKNSYHSDISEEELSEFEKWCSFNKTLAIFF